MNAITWYIEIILYNWLNFYLLVNKKGGRICLQQMKVTIHNATQIDHATGLDESLHPKADKDRTVKPKDYIFMWMGDGVNLGNMTLGASVIVAGVATLNIFQTILAAIAAIAIISTVFALNDRLGYKKGIPYVVQLRMSFGIKGTVISSLLRGIPAIVWYGIQSWIGGTALNEIAKIVTGGSFDNIFICFVALQLVQIVLSLFGFHAIKWVETIASVVFMVGLVYVFGILMSNYSTEIAQNWVQAEGSWGLPFFGLIMVFLGNYAGIFVSAADYSRELKTGLSDKKRGALYFFPITLSYGFVIVIGAMLAAATGITNPAQALPVVIDNPIYFCRCICIYRSYGNCDKYGGKHYPTGLCNYNVDETEIQTICNYYRIACFRCIPLVAYSRIIGYRSEYVHSDLFRIFRTGYFNSVSRLLYSKKTESKCYRFVQGRRSFCRI